MWPQRRGQPGQALPAMGRSLYFVIGAIGSHGGFQAGEEHLIYKSTLGDSPCPSPHPPTCTHPPQRTSEVLSSPAQEPARLEEVTEGVKVPLGLGFSTLALLTFWAGSFFVVGLSCAL